MASKLSVWNDALRRLADHPLSDTTTANTRQKALNDSWDAAVEYTLARVDWGFARRRVTLVGVSDTSFPPFTYRYARPSDYLRKCWIKTAAPDEFQIEHAEVATVFYGFAAIAFMEYMSDHADNYDPANWPPQFTRALSLYLALLVGPKIGRAADGDVKALYGELDQALGEAVGQEAVFVISTDIAAARTTTMRRALEFMGAAFAGSTAVQAQADRLRWQWNQTWDQCTKFVLEQAPWSFAIRRATLTGTSDTTGFPPYTYRFARPSGFLKRHWIRLSATDTFEADYAEAGTSIYGYASTLAMEYIAADANALDPTTWPASFIDVMALYLASQSAGLVTVTSDQGGEKQISASKAREGLTQQFAVYLDRARAAEAITFYNKSVAPERLPVMRRALEMMGQSLTGFTLVDEQAAKLRWSMTQTWEHAVKHVLAQGAWNFASKRKVFSDGHEADSVVPAEGGGGIIEGYSLDPDSSTADTTPIAGYDYGYTLPDDFVHKIWIKADVNNIDECPHQVLGEFIFCNSDPAIMEYVAYSTFVADPTNWPPLFVDAVAAFLALSVAPELAITEGGKGARVMATGLRDKLEANWQRRLSDAKNKDAIQQYPQQIAPGRFVRARAGGYNYGLRRLN